MADRNHFYNCKFLLNHIDILLNVFLAIAVDNLADADSLTGVEKEEEEGGANGAGDNMDANQNGKLQITWSSINKLGFIILLRYGRQHGHR